jgi:ABC-type branched-subunit amino acid transport system substrate-binding protein/outer membrane protein assembly factor BamD (BamD/ComL family)
VKSARAVLCEAALVVAAGAAFSLLFGCLPTGVEKRPVERVEPPEVFETAERDFRAEDYDEALEGYARYLDQYPKGEESRIALYRMATIRFRKGQFEEALDLFKRIDNEYPGHPDRPIVRHDIAQTYYRLGDYERSNEVATEWLKRYPGHPLKGEMLFVKGRNYKALGEISEAFQVWLQATDALRDFPDRRASLVERINGLIESSTLDELRQMARDAAGTDYEPAIYYRMANLYLEQNDLEDAKNSAMALIRSTPEEPWIEKGQEILNRIEAELSVEAGVIGCLLPLSGPFAIYGQEVLNGLLLGMKVTDLSEETESDLELVIRDTRGEIAATIAAVEDLVKNEKAIAIIGPLTSKTALAAAKKAQELRVPIITMTQKADIVAEGDMVFRNYVTPVKEVTRLLELAMQERSWSRFGILYPANSYGRYLMNLFWDRTEEMGGVITAVESYEPDQTDFADEIKKMVGLYYPRPESVKEMLAAMEEAARAAEDESDAPGALEPGEQDELDTLPAGDDESELPAESALDAEEAEAEEEEEEPPPIIDFDAVFIPDNYQQVALIAPQFPFHNVFNVPYLGTSLWESTDLIEMAGDYVQGAVFPSGFFIKSESERTIRFVGHYRENFDVDPGVLAANGYDTIMFLKGIDRNGEIKTRLDFQKALLESESFYGITGRIAFDEQGEVEKEPVLLMISRRRFRALP